MQNGTRRFSTTALTMLIFPALLLGACNKKKADDNSIEPQKGPIQAIHEVKVPAEVFAWVVTGSPKELLSNMESLASKAAPVPSGTLGESINQYLVKMGLKDTSVIKLSAPAGALILNTMKYPIPFLVAVSTKGQKALLASLKPEWKQKGEKKGIFQLSREIVDPYSVFKGGQDAAKTKKTEQSMYIKFDGTTALIALAPSVIEDAGKVLVDRLKDGAPAEGLKAAIHLDNIRTAFAMQLSMMPQLVKQQIEKTVTELPPQLVLSPKAMRWILGWLSDKGFAFLQQTKEITLAVGVTPKEAIIHTGIVAEAGSFFAKFLKKQKHADLKLARGLPDDAFLAMGMNVQWKFLENDLLDFTKEAFEVFTKEKASKENLELFKEWYETLGSEICVTENLRKGPSFEIVELIEITDEKKAEDLLKRLMAFMAEIYSSKSGMMGIRATVDGPKAAGEFQGVKLSETVLNMDFSSLPPLQADVINKVYPDGKMHFMTAIFDKTLAFSMGSNAEKTIKGAIERLKKKGKGFTESKVYTSASGELGKNAGGFAYLSLANMIYFTAKQVGGQDQLKVPEAKSGMFMKFSVDGRTMFSSMRLPAEHLEELGKAIQSLTQLANAPAPKAPAPASK